MTAAPLRVLRLCSVFEPPASALSGRGALADPVGGMQEHTGSLTRELQRRGLSQVVLTARPPTAPWVEHPASGVTVLRVGLPVRKPRRLYSVPAALLAPWLGRRADVVHVHLGEDLAILPLAALAARPRRLPVVLTVHCSLLHTLAVDDVRSAILHTLGGRIERAGERRADATLVYTARLAERLRDGPGGPAVRVVRRGVDRRAFLAPGPDPFPLLHGRPRVVFLGRVVRAKGVRTLVEAAARCRTPGMQVLLVGDGPDRRPVERLAQRLGLAGRVHVTGFVEHARVPDVLASADLLVLPSFYEELGTVLAEALHARVPVVAARVGGIPEIVEDGATGLLVSPGDAAELAAAIDRLLGDRALAARCSAAAGERAGAYDLERVAAEVEELYRGLALEWGARRAGLAPAPARVVEHRQLVELGEQLAQGPRPTEMVPLAEVHAVAQQQVDGRVVGDELGHRALAQPARDLRHG
jgi:glycosyltransferase involved in cell wall biosynthesis